MLLVLGLAPVVASAGMITYSIQYETTFTNDASASTSDTGFNAWTQPSYNTHWVHRLAFYYTATGWNADQDVQQVGFGIAGGTDGRVGQTGFTDGLSLSTKYATAQWRPSNPSIKIPDPGDPANSATATVLYGTNHDYGTANDLRGILAIMDNAVAWGEQHLADYNDPNTGNPYGTNMGPEIAPQKLGWIFIRWDGSAQNAGVSVFGDPTIGASYTVYDGNEGGLSNHVTAYGSTTTGYWSIPEPVTLSLLAIGSLALIRRRR